ncbi:MAG: hemolysin family protein [Acidimicrobiia bacterium]|nr:hemolysin family protein [Acidimicrobiia bacterium]
MTPTDTVLLALLVLALLAAVFMAAAEASLLRLSELRARSLAEAKDPKAERLHRLLQRLPEVLNLILLLALVSQIGAASLTGVLAQRWFGNTGVTVASIALTIVLFIYGEAIPKTYAIRNAEKTALRVSGPISILERLFRPLVAFLVWVADIQAPGTGIDTSPTVTESELRLLARRAAREGEITLHDRTLIERAFRFGDRSADDIMIPRPDIVAVQTATNLEAAIDIALRAGHRRIPVYEDSLENITGVVKLRDMIKARDAGGASLDELAFEPLIVPETKSVVGLLEEMQSTNTHVAIVVDEYGVTSGLVTVEDVAEELLGSISEEPREPDFQETGEGSWIVSGSLPVEDLERIGMDIPEGEWNTVAGLILGLAGRLLDIGESVEIDGYVLTVARVKRRRITRVSVKIASRSEDAEDAG